MADSQAKKPQTLHQLAEEKARLDEATALNTLSLDDARQLFHELRVYQIELEMQNEELRRTQHELESSRARYFSLYDLAPAGYLTLSEQGLIQEANLAVATMLGVMRDDLLKRPLSQFIFREDQDSYYLHRKKIFEANEVQVWEMRMVRADSSCFWARLQATPAQDGEYWITLVDITERKQAEDALQASRGKFKAYVDNSFDIIFALDAEGVFLFVSHAWERHFGYSLKELLGKNFAELVHPDDVPPCAGYIEQILKYGKSKTSPPYRVKHIDGSWRWFISNGSRYLDTNNEWQFLGVAHDVTERKQMEEQLIHAKEAAEAANRAKSNFLATMSHEIRTPLSAMLGNIELLEGSQLTPQQQEYLNDCKSASQMLLQIINDVLDFSKIEAGKLELCNETFSVPSMSRQLVRIFSASARQRGLELTILLGDNLPEYICGDQQRLRQIISNLLNNAIKFTTQGTVSLEITREPAPSATGPDKAVLRIVVRDTGIGIPFDKQEQVFESFTQVDSFRTRSASGTGLGLPICRRLLALMGGTITISSVPGEGSVFTVVLPVTPAQSPASVQTPALIQVQPAARKILLADDDERGRTVAQRLLEFRGYKVKAVKNGTELLDALQKEPFDIVITDISMPDMQGTQVARIIRSGERAGIDRGIPIIAMTAHAFSDDRDRFLAAGITGYVPKPVNLEELFRQIEELCGKSSDAGKSVEC